MAFVPDKLPLNQLAVTFPLISIILAINLLVLKSLFFVVQLLLQISNTKL